MFSQAFGRPAQQQQNAVPAWAQDFSRMSVSSQTPASQQNHRSEVAMPGQNQNARLYGLTNGGAGMMQNSMRMGMQGYSSQPGMIRSQDSDVAMKQGEGRLLSIH